MYLSYSYMQNWAAQAVLGAHFSGLLYPGNA